MRADQLKEEIIRLGPWHHDVEVTGEISTSAFLEAPPGTYAESDSRVGSGLRAGTGSGSRRDRWVNLIKRVYPEGLEGRSLMECACNCGAYCFWAKEIGASECFGFDVREHWINQARWLLEHREQPGDGIRFEQMDVYELPKAGLEPFDIVMFKGIFYHLPDPVTALKGAADLCKELLFLDTAVRANLPDGMLAVAQESVDPVMSGVHGLNWLPTGPNVLNTILRWLGFEETRVVTWFHKGRRGRITILAAREEGRLEGLPNLSEPKGQSPS